MLSKFIETVSTVGIAVFISFLGACAATSTKEIAQKASSGKLGCAPLEIVIVSHDEVTIAASRSWVAQCKGINYRCSGVSTGYFAYSDVSCTKTNSVAAVPNINTPPKLVDVVPKTVNQALLTKKTEPQPRTNFQAAVMSLTEAQQKLVDLKFLKAPADGKMGKNTADALKKFQDTVGITPSGKLDTETIEKLRAF